MKYIPTIHNTIQRKSWISVQSNQLHTAVQMNLPLLNCLQMKFHQMAEETPTFATYNNI